MNKRSKIGIFDSGLGGISVLSDIHKVMPNEDIIYFGDSANAPYGVKTKEQVYQLSKDICDEFIENDVKAIVIACNTATSAAVNRLRDRYDIPIIGMEPAIRPALHDTKGIVVVMATEMTLKEEKFNQLLDSFEEGYRVKKMPAPKLVDIVENHLDDESLVKATIAEYLDQLEGKISGIVLGCTHFIFLRDYIEDYFDYEVALFDGNMGTATHLRNILKQNDLLNEKTAKGLVEIHNSKSSEFLGKSIDLYKWLGNKK